MLDEYKIVDTVFDIPFENSLGRKLKMGAIKMSHNDNEAEHVLIYKGAIHQPKKSILLRINSACYTSDIFDCQRCDCHWQLQTAIDMIDKEGGLIIYHLHHEGRGSGFINKLKTYQVMDEKAKTTYDACSYLHLEPDQRRYFSSILILKELQINKVKIITNNTYKVDILKENGIEVDDVIPIVCDKESLKKYLISKRDQFGHIMKSIED